MVLESSIEVGYNTLPNTPDRSATYNLQTLQGAPQQARCLDERIVGPCELWGSTKTVHRLID